MVKICSWSFRVSLTICQQNYCFKFQWLTNLHVFVCVCVWQYTKTWSSCSSFSNSSLDLDSTSLHLPVPTVLSFFHWCRRISWIIRWLTGCFLSPFPFSFWAESLRYTPISRTSPQVNWVWSLYSCKWVALLLVSSQLYRRWMISWCWVDILLPCSSMEFFCCRSFGIGQNQVQPLPRVARTKQQEQSSSNNNNNNRRNQINISNVDPK